MSFAGRALKIKKGGTVIAGVISRSLTVGAESIDFTNDDSDGYRALLAANGTRSLDLSVDGVTEDRILRGAALGTGSLMLTDITIEWPDGDTISGNFFFSNYSESGDTNQPGKFSASFQSSEEWIYTAGA